MNHLFYRLGCGIALLINCCVASAVRCAYAFTIARYKQEPTTEGAIALAQGKQFLQETAEFHQELLDKIRQ